MSPSLSSRLRAVSNSIPADDALSFEPKGRIPVRLVSIEELRRAKPGANPTALLAFLIFAWLAPASFGQSPSITQQPTSQTIFYGDPVTFNVIATGTLPFSYQWLRNGAPITAATSNAYTLSPTSGNDHNAGFAVRVANSFGAITSVVATLTIDFGVPGAPLSFRVLDFGSDWRYNQSNNLDGVSWFATNYNDSVWQIGKDLLAAESNPNITPLIGTTLLAPNTPPPGLSSGHAYYFRTRAMLTNDFIQSGLQVTFRADDGAVVYTNGAEAARIRMPAGTITNLSFTTGFPPDPTPGGTDATIDETLLLQGGALALGTNTIAVSVHQANSGSSDIVWGMALDVMGYERLRDTQAPFVNTVIPPNGSTLPALREIEIDFSEAVKGVQAGDLLINDAPATNVTVVAPDVYVFSFPQPATGQVQVTWNAAQSIVDLSANSNRFDGSAVYTYTLDPSGPVSQVMITEFMAANSRTMRDEDGSYSDWIEIYNSGFTDAALNGWYLTDNPAKLTKWRFPSGVVLSAYSYLVVWASGKDRTNAAAPLHTNFKLDKSAGNFLALVLPDGVTIASSFIYPQQFDDVSYGRDRSVPSITGYFTNATPGAPNATIGSGFASEVKFSKLSSTFQQPFALTLTTDTAGAQIRYFIVTNAASAALTDVPNDSCPVYTSPLTIDTNLQVRARVFPTQSELFPGPLRSETYLKITSGAAAFSSEVPIVLFHNFTGGTPPATADQPAVMMVFDNKFGRASLTNPADLSTRIGLSIRGSSTQGLAKKSFGVETWDEFNDDKAFEVAGLPEESDWIFYAPNGFDKPLIHNSFIHDLSRQIGRYSPRVRMVEVFTSFGSGSVNYSSPTIGNYNGIYVLEEKIKADDNRVDIPRLQPEETSVPAVTGGYILKIDRSDPDERTVYAASVNMVYVEPKMGDFATYPGRALQENYIQGYFNSFFSALTGANWTNPVTGYAAWIDVDSWIDHHILNVLALNADSLRLSGFFFKDRNKKIEMGPLWDFDRSMGANDGNDWRSWNPRTWMASNPLGSPTSSDYGTDYFNAGAVFSNPWYRLLFNDPNFWQKWIDRYQQLRDGDFSKVSLFNIIGILTNKLAGAQVREASKWAGPSTPRFGTVTVPAGWPDTSYSYNFSGTYPGEINFLKQWLSDRLSFMDTNFLSRPTLNATGGLVNVGQFLTVSPAAEAGTKLLYTLNGTDPRLPGGAISPAAFSNNAPVTIQINTNVRVFARSWNPGHHNLTGARNPPISSPWSGPTADTFYVALPPLRVTEIMFHPLPPPAGNTNDADNFEFIEVKNTSGVPLNLQGFRLRGGIDFLFPNLTLAAGQHAVVVKDFAAFQSRYGSGILVAGIYTNNLGNGGDHIVLEGPLAEPILDFNYSDDWYPTADGLGFSLVIRDPGASADTWNTQSSWRPSGAINGSPGQTDPTPPNVPGVLITEALTHTDLPQVDTVELFNPTATTADISGWLLTDDPGDPVKYRIVAGTAIGPGAYVTFTTNQFGAGPTGFALSSLGDEIYLFSADANTNLTGYAHGFNFGTAPNGVSFGRYVNSSGDGQFVLQSRNTLATNNAYPRIGPVVISEIMYHPPDLPFAQDDSLDEFIELHNIAVTNVPLYDPNAPTNTWQLRNAVDYDFPTNVTMLPGDRLLVVSFDPTLYPSAKSAFITRYGVPTNVPIFGLWTGKLDNSEDTIELKRPDNPNVTPTNVFVPYYLVEKVTYRDIAPWPTNADGGGASLQRIEATLFGNDAMNWQSALPTAGSPNPAGPPPDADHDGLPDAWEVAQNLDPMDASGDNGADGDPDHDGMSNLEEFIAGTDPRNAQDVFFFARIAMSNNVCVLEFDARTGRTYTIETANSLNATNTWLALTNGIPGTGGRIVVSDPAGQNGRFYRIRATRD